MKNQVIERPRAALAPYPAATPPLFSTSALVVLATVLSGCGSHSSEPKGFTSTTAEIAVLHEVEVGEVRYRFLDASEAETPSVILEQDAPLHVGPATPLAQVLASDPDLTVLEIYLALAPNGEAPAEQLIASHLLEVSLLGRADDAIRRVAFEPGGLSNVLTEKSLATCRTVVKNYLKLSWPRDISTHGMSAVPDGDLNWAIAEAWPEIPFENVTTALAVALCNESSSTTLWAGVSRFRGTYWEGIAGGWVNPGRWYAYRWGVTSFGKNIAVFSESRHTRAFHATGAYGYYEDIE